MKRLLLILVLAFAQTSFGQNLFFSKENYTDSILFKKNIPAFAEKIIAVYKNPDPATYSMVVSRLQLLAGNYIASNKILDSIVEILVADTALGKAVAFNVRMFNEARMASMSSGSFLENYKSLFIQHYSQLTEDTRMIADSYFDAPIQNFKSDFDSLVKKHIAYGSDSISISDAVALCNRYSSWMICDQTFSDAKNLIAQLNQNYISDDSVLIKTSGGGTIPMTIIRRKDIKTAQPVVLMYLTSGNCKR